MITVAKTQLFEGNMWPNDIWKNDTIIIVKWDSYVVKN
jgi:hypothetical protein